MTEGAQLTGATVILGRIGIVDAELVRYIELQRQETEPMLLHVIGSIYRELIAVDHIERFLSEIRYIDKVISSRELQRIADRRGTKLVCLQEEELRQYSCARLRKEVALQATPSLQGSNEVVSIEQLVRHMGTDPRGRKRTLGLVTGVFDVIHLGHVQLIKKAREVADVVIVATMTTSCIERLGKDERTRRPVYSLEDRIKVLHSLRDVDGIVVFEDVNCMKLIRSIRPTIYVKHTRDISRQIIKDECGLVESLGGKVVLCEDSTYYSSTDIINYVLGVSL